MPGVIPKILTLFWHFLNMINSDTFKILTLSDFDKFWTFQILTLPDFGIFLFWHFQILTLSYSDTIRFRHFLILTLSNSDTFRFGTKRNYDTFRFWHLCFSSATSCTEPIDCWSNYYSQTDFWIQKSSVPQLNCSLPSIGILLNCPTKIKSITRSCVVWVKS